MNQYPQQQYQQNPYAAPQAQVMPAGYGQAPMSARVEGASLVVPNGATFPAVCLKCGNQQGIEWRNQRYTWIPPWARFFGWLIQMLVAKRSRFQLPLCQPCHSQWKKWNLFLWLSFLPLFLFIFIGAAIAGATEDGGAIAGILITLGVVGFIVGLIVAIVFRNKKAVTAIRIDKQFSWLRGIHPNVMQMVAMGAAPQAYAQPMMQQGYPQQQAYPQQGYPQQGGGYGYPQQ